MRPPQADVFEGGACEDSCGKSQRGVRHDLLTRHRIRKANFVGSQCVGADSGEVVVVPFYNNRGTAEQWSKEGMRVAKMTRRSYHRFRSNKVRLGLRVLTH